jgi:hypothetical protein
MRTSGFGNYALGLCASFAMLAGCGGGSQSQLAPSGPLQQSSAQSRLGQLSEGVVDTRMSGGAQTGVVALHPDLGRSWMSPGATSKDLLYISNYASNSVVVYSYPQDKLVGTLTGFHEPDGLCTDKKGGVWIVNNQESQSSEDVVEYKHGGTKPIATVYDPGEIPVACSIDPTTGNLAVTNIETYASGPGSVALYGHAKGSATLFAVPQMVEVYFCGYDDKGNLFVDGVGSHGFLFAELPKGKKTFKNITLKGGTILYPGEVQWDGKYVAVGDQEYQLVGSPPEYDSAIYQTTGAGGKIVGTTVFGGSHDVVGFRIEGKTVIGGDRSPYGYKTPDDVAFYKYPAGGKPTKTLKKGFDQPYGVAISLGPQ